MYGELKLLWVSRIDSKKEKTVECAKLNPMRTTEDTRPTWNKVTSVSHCLQF